MLITEVSVSRSQRRIGIALTAIAALLLIMDAVAKLAGVQEVLETHAKLGYPGTAPFARGLGALLAMCTALYIWPRTAALGALLLTGYLGGAVATHVRVGDPLFSHVLFGVYIGVFVWGGLYLRDGRVRALFASRY